MKINVRIPRQLANPGFTKMLKAKSLAIASIIGNGVSTYIFTKRALDFKEKTKDLEGRELAKETVKTFTLPTIIFIGANTCTLYSNVLSEKQIAGLIASNVYTANKLKSYRHEIESRYGKQTEADIHRAVIRREVTDEDAFSDVIVYSNSRGGQSINTLPEGPLIFWSQWHKQYFETDAIAVLDAFKGAHISFQLQSYLYLNQLFHYLGWPQLDDYDMVGWDMIDGYSTLDFEIHKLKDTDIYYVYSLYDPDIAAPFDE